MMKLKTICVVCLVFKWILLISTFHKTVLGQHHGPSYTSTGRHCASSDRCVESIGEICWWSYSGCAHGRCMCDPRSQFLDATGKCRQRKFGSESCGPGDRCPVRMHCRAGRCECAGRDTTMTNDRRFCLRQYERLLGQSCDVNSHSCYQATGGGYQKKMVGCINGQCSCSPGYKTVGNRCRRLNIAEGSCSRDHHCQGGALCVEQRCVCPSGYVPVAGNSKCAKQGAQYDLELGSICDEVNEQRYCSQGLVCHRCPNEHHYTCVKYREFQTYSGAIMKGVDKTVTVICVLTGVLAALLFILIRYYCCR